MDSALALHRLHFAFTVTFHYLFPQLTMGLALLIVVLKAVALKTGDHDYDKAARFWGRIFALNFAMGVVTGIPMEFQFGTNWARFSKAAGGVIGQTLAMEGLYSFVLESSFLGLFLFGEKRLGKKLHFVSAVLVFLGSWLSGFFIIATDAWMQHPVAYEIKNGQIVLTSLWGLLTNPWVPWQYLHNMIASVATASFVMAGIGAFYLLTEKHEESAQVFLKVGVIGGFLATGLLSFPTGDAQAKNVALNQPVTLAAMEGMFTAEESAGLALIGQPDMEKMRLDNPLIVPKVLSFLTHHRWNAEIKGLRDFPRDQWPDNVPLLYFAYHIMVGLGTIISGIMAIAALLLWQGWLHKMRPMLWILMLATPAPRLARNCVTQSTATPTCATSSPPAPADRWRGHSSCRAR